MYRAKVEITTFSRQGWDSHEDVEYEYIVGDSEEGCKVKAKEYIDKVNKHRRVGDFGIVVETKTGSLICIERYEVVYP